MHRVKQAITLLLVGATILVSMPSTSVFAHNQVSIVDKLAELFKQKVRRGGTRGPICVLTPGLSKNQQIWSDRPLFVWYPEKVARIQVRQSDSKTLVWEEVLPQTQTSVTYSGTALESGKTYEIALFDNNGTNLTAGSSRPPKFMPLDIATRTRVTNALNAIEHQFRNQQKTPEEITAIKVQYLLEQNLISDAFQTAYVAQDSSSELKGVVHEVTKIACGQETLNALTN